MLHSSPGARRITLVVAGIFTLAACSKDSGSEAPASAAPGTPAAAAQAEEDLADVSKYRLSMDKIDKYLAAQRNIAAKAASLTPAQRAAMEANN